MQRKGTDTPRRSARLKKISGALDSEIPKSHSKSTANVIDACPEDEIVIPWQPGNMTTSAINKALDIPEILEMILAQVDMRTLLTSQRVCRNWVAVISKSPSIQKALFFTPIQDSEWGMEKKILNPLLMETFLFIFSNKDRRNCCGVEVSVNPYEENPPWGRIYDYSVLLPRNSKTCCGLNFYHLTMAKDASTMARFVHKDATWRKMLVRQPPILEIGLLHYTCIFMDESLRSSSIPASQEMQKAGYDGIRMERLFELLLFNERVQSSGREAQVYWSAEELTISDEWSHKSFNNEFHQMMSKFGLIVYTRQIIAIAVCGGCDYPLKVTEVTRSDIIAAYRKGHLGIKSRKRAIKKAEVEIGVLKEDGGDL
ncbi:hypothetical protein N7520_011831 [Penicillium odoratum]|uniref:uncharacterized protein n=1 Tax=Penicillium odoratum TaxID=1167516 RepID=UPI0025483025|nr:uncharacterized protein N7520_011831 [Penicillium odoratum]KAJ5746649.1 hypothetical protein N7520_011831 [Penicillium odoratum]